MTRKAVITCAVLLLAQWAPPSAQAALPEVCAVEPSQNDGELAISVGGDNERAWLDARYAGLRIRKFTQAGGANVIEFRHATDVVVISVAPAGVTIVRDGRTLTVDTSSPQAYDAVHDMLGSSRALARARTLLARLEGSSRMEAPEFSLLSAIAFASALTGDAGAPRRVADRFAAVHFGRFRPIAFAAGSCWTDYTGELLESDNDLAACINEAREGSIYLRSLRENFCSTTWILRVESAWFEYLNCVGILSMFKE